MALLTDPQDYVPLWVKSNYSFLEGASHPEELVEQAHAWGLPAVAMTDRDGVYGIVRAFIKARELGIKLLTGAQITVQHEQAQGRASVARQTTVVVALAQTRLGYGNLCQLLSKGQHHCAKGEAFVTVSELQAVGEDVLLLCPHASLLAPLAPVLGDRLYALCTRHLEPDETTRNRHLVAMAERYSVPVVAGVEVLYHAVYRRPLQDVQTCIRHGVTLSNGSAYLRVNGEHAIKTPHAMAQLFRDHPEWLRRTVDVANRCTFDMSHLRYRYPAESLPAGFSEAMHLRQLTMRGAHRRYGEVLDSKIVAQLDKELALIHELDYGGYFLTMWEIVQFCRSANILCQGRGSAANSAVCYCLGITAVNPMTMDLLFERFISRERPEPPDIDLDIEHNRREEVIQWVYQRYGRRHAAMVANCIRFRMRSAVREVGKALGLPLTALDRLSKVVGMRDGELDGEALSVAGVDPQAPVAALLQQRVAEILDYPRHLSIHPGGFLLGHEPVDTLVPIEPGTMADRTVIQWDKQDVEDLGLFKVDLLGLGALTQVHGCFDLLEKHLGQTWTMATVPQEDPATYAMITRADTVGLFQIESRAQMSMLPRLKPNTFYDLVVEVAIVRPGPIQGDMVHPYLLRREGKEPITYPHPSFEQVLRRTFGVPIFQEQVMKLAVVAVGYTPGEADQLRRDMAAWRSAGRIEQHYERFVQRLKEKGVSDDYAERIFAQIRGFGEYGFPESHAASFALIAYITAWLKCHYPAAFACSLLNAQPMGFYSAATIVEDAKRHGVVVLPIAMQHSQWDCTLEKHNEAWAVRMGFCFVKGLTEQDRTRLEAEPAPYADMQDFLFRTNLPQKSLLTMAQAGVFDSEGVSRRDALWAIRGFHATRHDTLSLPSGMAPRQTSLFPTLSASEKILWDYRTSFHSALGHPMQTIRRQLPKIPSAQEVQASRDGAFVSYVGLVICRQRPQTASGVAFFTLEDETGFVNVVLWKQVFAQFSLLAKTATLLGVKGRLQKAHDVVHLVAQSLWAPQVSLAIDGMQSRDFH